MRPAKAVLRLHYREESEFSIPVIKLLDLFHKRIATAGNGGDKDLFAGNLTNRRYLHRQIVFLDELARPDTFE